MNAPAIITAPYARLSTSVTPNCRVKPTEAMARTEAVTSPNPREERKIVTAGPPPVRPRPPARPGFPGGNGKPGLRQDTWSVWSSGDGPQLRCGQVADDVHVAIRAVRIHLEDARRVVVTVEVGGPARSFIPDRLARLDLRSALGERVAHRSAGNAVPDLDDVRPVHARAGALRHDHGQRGQVDRVVEVHAAWCAQVGGEVAGGTRNLPLLGKQRLGERLVGQATRSEERRVGKECR